MLPVYDGWRPLGTGSTEHAMCGVYRLAVGEDDFGWWALVSIRSTDDLHDLERTGLKDAGEAKSACVSLLLSQLEKMAAHAATLAA